MNRKTRRTFGFTDETDFGTIHGVIAGRAPAMARAV
jgi:hypothetical protein